MSTTRPRDPRGEAALLGWLPDAVEQGVLACVLRHERRVGRDAAVVGGVCCAHRGGQAAAVAYRVGGGLGDASKLE